ncbi:hypothetical protein GCM10027396_31350 [Insolitispirillum peregrinum]
MFASDIQTVCFNLIYLSMLTAYHQCIDRLTGKRFTGLYRRDVLADHRQMFDSGPATVALTAIALTAPVRDVEVLRRIQQARSVEGRGSRVEGRGPRRHVAGHSGCFR